jgi:hypothetical protein
MRRGLLDMEGFLDVVASKGVIVAAVKRIS